MKQRQIPPTPSASKGKDGPRRLLLIDDQAAKMKTMFEALEPYGYLTSIEASSDNAIKSVRTYTPDVVLLDLHFPGDDLDAGGATTGGRLLGQIQREFPRLPVVVFTTRLSDDRLSLETMNPQRYYAQEKIDQLRKSGEDWAADLARTLGQAINDMELKEKSPEELDAEMGFVVGKSPLMQKVVETIRSAASTAMTVLIEGETGTGKELVAKAIHRLSGRKPFTAINCSGVHEETLHAMLFGHEDDAFTGAKKMKKGLFDEAAGGTVFLDEIQDMPASLQHKLVRVVEEKIFKRMGGSVDIAFNVRLIGATNRPAQDLVKEDRLREDLYFRLSTLAITLPPLIERKEDIPLLWPVLIERANKAAGKTVMPTLRKEVRELLIQHKWPGNIRELEHVISRAVLHAKGNILLTQDFDLGSSSSALGSDAPSGIITEMGANTVVEAHSSVWGGDVGKIAARLAAVPAEQRYDILMKNTAGDLQKNVLIEIICKLRASHPQKKVTSKELTGYLCGYRGEEEFKKADGKLRTRMSGLKVSLTELNCNQ
ncbi:MAG TPA: sigma-54-dependent Fis family transcriptional regulator [Proteobacteria bacterium]|nr:sigma-54-dependent Fis family transcriptional regulator [Pseudomonadota bacterium]